MTPNAPRPNVRTTKHRGRMTAARRLAWTNLLDRWSLAPDTTGTSAEIGRAFGRSGPVLIDLGFGNGQATKRWALDQPDSLVIGVELHRPGIAQLLVDLETAGPANVRVVYEDALDVLVRLDVETITALRVLFPDPWPKRRHHERRIVSSWFVDRCATVLVPGGQLHLATDSTDYGEHMRSMLAADARFVLETDDVRPPRPVTAYEQRGIDAGRTITDLVYRRR